MINNLPCPFCGENNIEFFLYMTTCGYTCNKCKVSFCFDHGFMSDRSFIDIEIIKTLLNKKWNTRHSPWVSVKDQSVPTMKTVILCNEYGTVAGYFLYGSDKPTVIGDFKFESPVTHWQPLPSPPKETTNE